MNVNWEIINVQEVLCVLSVDCVYYTDLVVSELCFKISSPYSCFVPTNIHQTSSLTSFFCRPLLNKELSIYSKLVRHYGPSETFALFFSIPSRVSMVWSQTCLLNPSFRTRS